MKIGVTRREWLGASCMGALGVAFTAAAGAAGVPAVVQNSLVSDWPGHLPTPALDASNLQGERVRLSDFQGRAVLLNFWATWCPPCRAEMPSLQALSDWWGEDQLVVLALNHREAGRTARRFMAAAGLKLPVLLDPSGELTQAWGVRVFPSTVLIDRQGRARQVVRGEVDWNSSQALGWVEQLLSRR